jgi:hypothetical protein
VGCNRTTTRGWGAPNLATLPSGPQRFVRLASLRVVPVTSNWSVYQSTSTEVDKLLRDAQVAARQRREQLQATGKDIDDVNAKIATQQRHIRDVEERLSFFANATPETVEPRGVAGDLKSAMDEINACERALEEAQAIGRRPPFFPDLSNDRRSIIAGLAFAPVPLLAVAATDITGLWSIVAAAIAIGAVSWLTCSALSAAYKVLCRPRLKEWKTSQQGHRLLQPINNLIETSGLVACWLPAALLYLYKVVT